MLQTEELKKLANLARVSVTPTELRDLEKSLGDILGYVSEIKTVSGAPQGKGGALDASSLRNVMREDNKPHASGEFSEELLSGVPKREGARVRVKKFF